MPQNSIFSLKPYSIVSSDDLQCKVDESSKKITYTGSTNSCSSAVQGCPFTPKTQSPPENKNCTFTGIIASKSNRKFDYAWNKTEGVVKDGNKDSENIFEIISGDTKVSEVSIEKNGLAGPCTEQKHKGKSWDIEGYPNLDDKKISIKLPMPKADWLTLQYYLPSNFSGKEYQIKAIKCGGSQAISIKCYPDTQLKLSGSFTFFDGTISHSRFDDTETNKSGKKGEVFLELMRNGAQSFKVDVLKYENTKKYETSTYSGDYSQTGTAKYNQAKADGTHSKEELQALKTFKSFQEYQTKWNNFFEIKEKLFGEFDKCAKNPISFNVTFLKAKLDFSAGWIEIPASRYCDFQYKGNFSFSPLLSITVDWDFTNLVTYVPYIGQLLMLTKLFLQKFNLGELAIKFEIRGQIGVSSDFIDVRLRNIHDVYKDSVVSLNGEIGVTLRAYAKGNVKIDRFFIKCGGEAQAEAGCKAKLGDTDTIYNDLKDYMKDKKDSKGKETFNKLENPESRKSKLYFKNGKLILNAKIGFSGLIIYTIAYVEGSCSANYHNSDPPESFSQQGAGSTLTISSPKNTSSGGLTLSLGSKEENVHTVILANPLIWSPEINMFGN